MANTSKQSVIEQNDTKTFHDEEVLATDDIRSHAYALYESRGREHGHDLEDWLLAEQQAKNNFRKTHSSNNARSR